MPRKTVQNDITSPELIKQVNADNQRLMNDYLAYLKSIQRSENTITSYQNDLEIFFVWCLQHAGNKSFISITKRDVISYQNFLLYQNKNSPARVRRLKSTLSSLSNYIEAILDDEYPQFRNIIKKVENPVNQATREKTVFSDDDLNTLLDKLVEEGQYQKACMLALAMSSGRRKSELVRFKPDYFTDDNIIYGSLYKTPEKIKTKGRGLGKFLHCYVLVSKFKPYYDLWMKERETRGIKSEWLFVSKNSMSGNWEQLKVNTLNGWAESFSRKMGMDFYWHSLRHYHTTGLARLGLPDNVIQEIVGWESADMVRIYKDISTDEELGKYFDENGVKEPQKTGIADL